MIIIPIQSSYIKLSVLACVGIQASSLQGTCMKPIRSTISLLHSRKTFVCIIYFKIINVNFTIHFTDDQVILCRGRN